MYIKNTKLEAYKKYNPPKVSQFIKLREQRRNTLITEQKKRQKTELCCIMLGCKEQSTDSTKNIISELRMSMYLLNIIYARTIYL